MPRNDHDDLKGGGSKRATPIAPISDPINPSHYTDLAVKPIDAIEAWGLGFSLGNAVKYIARHKRKGRPLEDLKKARWYLDRAIKLLESVDA